VSEQNPLPSGQRARIALATILKAVVRILLVCLAAILLGGLIYLSFVAVYQQAVLPARENANRISLLETSQAQIWLQLDQRLASFQQRMTSLENQRQITNESIDELIADQDRLQAELDRQTEELTRLDDLQTELENVRASADRAWAMSIQNYQLTIGKDQMIASLERQIVVLKVAGLLNRSRLYMAQSNFGLARNQVEMARELLTDLQARVSDQQKNILSAWIGRLDSALAYLPETPVLAADELEIAWSLILRGLPEQFPPTPTPYIPSGSATPATVPTHTGTPLRPSLSPTPTPFSTPSPLVSPTHYVSPT
jgi:hypothetical protein